MNPIHKRYQIITYHEDCGLDEKQENDYILNIHKLAKAYLKEGYQEVYIYDYKYNRIAYAYNVYYVPSHYFSKNVDTKTTVIFTPETIKLKTRA